jgi:hypothetical protein
LKACRIRLLSGKEKSGELSLVIASEQVAVDEKGMDVFEEKEVTGSKVIFLLS